MSQRVALLVSGLPASWLACRRGVTRDRSRDRDHGRHDRAGADQLPFKAAGPALLVDREPSPTVTETLTAMSRALLAGLVTVEPVQPRWHHFGWTALPVVAGRSGKGNTGCSSMFRAGQIHRRSSSSVILMPWQSLLSMHTTI
jgi:hypothetical protein